MNKTVIVTGGAGFIGSNLAAALVAKGLRVVVCDVLGDGDKWRNLSKHGVAEIIKPADIFYWLEMFGESLEAIFHLGAISSTTERDVDMLLETNFAFSLLLWRWCAGQEKRFIYASSAATYGDGAQGFDDDASPAYLRSLRPLNPYGWSKHLFDQQVAASAAGKEPAPVQWVGLKFFNVYGPNEYHKASQASAIYHFALQALGGNPVRLFKSTRPDVADGEQRRDFVHVRDCVKIMLWLYDNPKVNGLFNIGTGHARSFNEVAQALFAALGRPLDREYIDMPENLREHYQYFTQSPINRLRQAGYTTPFTSLEDGIADYLQRYLTQADAFA